MTSHRALRTRALVTALVGLIGGWLAYHAILSSASSIPAALMRTPAWAGVEAHLLSRADGADILLLPPRPSLPAVDSLGNLTVRPPSEGDSRDWPQPYRLQVSGGRCILLASEIAEWLDASGPVSQFQSSVCPQPTSIWDHGGHIEEGRIHVRGRTFDLGGAAVIDHVVFSLEGVPCVGVVSASVAARNGPGLPGLGGGRPARGPCYADVVRLDTLEPVAARRRLDGIDGPVPELDIGTVADGRVVVILQSFARDIEGLYAIQPTLLPGGGR